MALATSLQKSQREQPCFIRRTSVGTHFTFTPGVWAAITSEMMKIRQEEQAAGEDRDDNDTERVDAGMAIKQEWHIIQSELENSPTLASDNQHKDKEDEDDGDGDPNDI